MTFGRLRGTLKGARGVDVLAQPLHSECRERKAEPLIIRDRLTKLK